MRKILLTPILIAFILSVANAQKLPNVQTASLRAPANIKIDGKTTEWNDQFQANNRATDIFYTVSNDDTKLYLTVQVKDAAVINKIMGGGITFTIQTADKKIDKGGIAITYPLFDGKNRLYVHNNHPGAGMFFITSDVAVSVKPAEEKEFQGDSVMQSYNKRLSDNSKYIGVTGIKSLDTLISVYNTDGIKVAERFDNKITYTYELAIDLKLLGLQAGGTGTFNYHVAINGSSLFNLPGNEHISVAGSDGGIGTAQSDGGGANQPPVGVMAQEATTDFWGKYTLAKQ